MAKVFGRKDPVEELEALQSAHTCEEIHKRLENPGGDGGWVKDFVFGALDGSVTTFAVVTGVNGGNLPDKTCVILGVCNLLGDGFAMACGSFLGARAELHQLHAARRREEYHVDRCPEGERDEVREIYRRKGFTGDSLERAVEVICSDRKRWVDTMVVEEWGLSLDEPQPVKVALVMMTAFILLGFVPLLPYVWNAIVPARMTTAVPFFISIALTGLVFIAVGIAKAPFIGIPWWKGMGETLALGVFASAISYAVAALLDRIVKKE